MRQPVSALRVIPRPIRRGAARLLDQVVPQRWQLPYTSAKLRLQGALDEEIGWLPRLLSEGGGVAVDVGANIGLYSYYLSRLCDRVEAFEPNRTCSKILESYGAHNINLHRVALSSAPGSLVLNIPVADGVQQPGLASARVFPEQEVVAIEVPKRTLDSYNIAGIRFLKIDVEGHELDVLAGAEKSIRRDLPTLLVEIEERYQGVPIETITGAFLALGYRGYFVFQGVLRPLADFDLAFHQRDYLAGRQSIKYVNNFFFLNPSKQANSSWTRKA